MMEPLSHCNGFSVPSYDWASTEHNDLDDGIPHLDPAWAAGANYASLHIEDLLKDQHLPQSGNGDRGNGPTLMPLSNGGEHKPDRVANARRTAVHPLRLSHPHPLQHYESAIPTPAPSPTFTMDSLPIIDISPFLNPASTPQARQDTATAIDRACVDFGFFYVTGHGIPVSKLDQIIDLARQFFSLPLSEKNKIKRHDAGGPEGGDGARGYQGMGENITLGRRDVQEAVDLYREWDHDKKADGPGGPGTHKTLQGPNLWPEAPVDLKPVYLDYISQLQKVGEALVRAMGVALDLGPSSSSSSEDEEIFVRNSNHSFWVMRMIGYPKLQTPLLPGQDPSEFSCGQHTDYGSVTLLLADPTPGALQVLLKDGRTWLNADPIPGAFVVNIGDMVERWTNGLWKSTRHRVIHRGDGYRVSVPFFYEPNFDAMVKPLRKCVERTGGVPVHEGNTYGEHLLGKVFNNFYSEVAGEEKEV